jgi:hypothetical protein
MQKEREAVREAHSLKAAYVIFSHGSDAQLSAMKGATMSCSKPHTANIHSNTIR